MFWSLKVLEIQLMSQAGDITEMHSNTNERSEKPNFDFCYNSLSYLVEK